MCVRDSGTVRMEESQFPTNSLRALFVLRGNGGCCFVFQKRKNYYKPLNQNDVTFIRTKKRRRQDLYHLCDLRIEINGGVESVTKTMSSAISHNVFVYGSLLSDDVVSALLNRVPSSSPALLNGYHRFSIKERVYPAILPVEGKQVDGRVLMGLTVPELDILDVFEDVEYFRDLVEVSLVGNAEKVQAFTYVWDDKDDPNLYGDWNFEEWKQLHMSDFLKMTKEFVEEFEQPDAKTRVETYKSHYQQDDNKASL